MPKQPIPSLASVPVTAPAEAPHVRISAELVGRVREAAHPLRRDKQDIAEEALNEWLAGRGL